MVRESQITKSPGPQSTFMSSHRRSRSQSRCSGLNRKKSIGSSGGPPYSRRCVSLGAKKNSAKSSDEPFMRRSPSLGPAGARLRRPCAS